MQHEDTDLELLIDRALAAYSDPGEAGGSRMLAAGALQRIEEHATRRRRWSMVFAIGAPALAALLLALFLLPRHSGPQVQRTVAAAPVLVVPQPAPAAYAQVVPARPHIVRVHRKTMAKKRRLPKLEQFPTPQPPSEQELLLAKFVQEAPADVIQAIVRQQQSPTEPLRISKLRIPPLTSH